jgi:hypothetical protein
MTLAVGYRPMRFRVHNAHAGGGLDGIVMDGFMRGRRCIVREYSVGD